MKKLLLIVASLIVVFHVSSLPAVYGQPKQEQITAEEKKAAQDLSDRFVKRLNETGDVEPLIKEMFVSDFMSRYVKEKRQERHVSVNGILFTSGLSYDPGLLVTANEDDWRILYVNTFNFMNYGVAIMFNAQAKALKSGKEPDEDELYALLSKMYPPTVMKLVNSNLILRNMLQMGEDARPIKDFEELREFNKLLSEVNRSLIGKPEGKLTAESQAVSKKGLEMSGGLSTPSVAICASECYGFDRGTRLLKLFATPFHALTIAKVGTDYKIISAILTSPG